MPRAERVCSICLVAARDAMLEPCGHGGLCYECGKHLVARRYRCPLCRARIVEVLKFDRRSAFVDGQGRRVFVSEQSAYEQSGRGAAGGGAARRRRPLDECVEYEYRPRDSPGRPLVRTSYVPPGAAARRRGGGCRGGGGGAGFPGEGLCLPLCFVQPGFHRVPNLRPARFD